jgi:cytoskeletal protein CcmA (bactofilin family)
VIGEAGRIKGTVVCANAEILGMMDGKITCHQQLSLRASGKIQGDVITKTLIVEPGAQFNGTCQMGQPKMPQNEVKK